MAGSHVFRSLTAGATHACGVTMDGEAWCWGSHEYGKLGVGAPAAGDTGRRLEPTRVATSERFTEVIAGPLHTCGLTTAGVVFCWGNNVSGQLGEGGVGMSYFTPVSVRWP